MELKTKTFLSQLSVFAKRGHSQLEGLFIVCINAHAFCCLSALNTLWPTNGELSSWEAFGCQPVEASASAFLMRAHSSFFLLQRPHPPPLDTAPPWFPNQSRRTQSWGVPQRSEVRFSCHCCSFHVQPVSQLDGCCYLLKCFMPPTTHPHILKCFNSTSKRENERNKQIRYFFVHF